MRAAIPFGPDNHHPLTLFQRQFGVPGQPLHEILTGQNAIAAANHFLCAMGAQDHRAMCEKTGYTHYMNALHRSLVQGKVGAARFLNGGWRDLPLVCDRHAAEMMMAALQAHDFAPPASAESPKDRIDHMTKHVDNIGPFLACVKAGVLPADEYFRPVYDKAAPLVTAMEGK